MEKYPGKKNIAVFISGRGSNLKSLIKYLPDVNMVSYKTKFSTKSDIFKSKFIDKNLNKSFFSKYLVPIIGIFYGWFYYIQNKKFIYLNYLPLWNFLLFVLMPPKTLFGPITGGIYKGSANNIENFLCNSISARVDEPHLDIIRSALFN